MTAWRWPGASITSKVGHDRDNQVTMHVNGAVQAEFGVWLDLTFAF